MCCLTSAKSAWQVIDFYDFGEVERLVYPYGVVA
jgi:hypothetical protein